MKKFLIALMLPLFLLGGSIAAAQDGPPSPSQGYKLLAPLPGTTLGPNAPVNPNALAGYLQTLFNIGVGVAIALAVVMIVIGGAQYLSTDAVYGKQEGIGKLKSAVTGLILALGIYLILAEVNPDILKLNLTVGGLTQTKLQEIAINNKPAVNPTLGLSDATLEKVFSDDARVRAALLNSPAGIPVNKPACKTANESNCTNVGGLPEQTVQGLIAFKLDCDEKLRPTNCNVVVTGGTEWWAHSSHGPGKRVVDIRATPAINKFLINQEANPSVRMVSPNKWGGATFTFEPSGDNAKNTGAHWHVSNL